MPFLFCHSFLVVFCVCLIYYRWISCESAIVLCHVGRLRICIRKKVSHTILYWNLSGLCVCEHVHCICELLVYRSSNFYHHFYIKHKAWAKEGEEMLKIFLYLEYGGVSFFPIPFIFFKHTLYTHLMFKNDTITTLKIRALMPFSRHKSVCMSGWVSFSKTNLLKMNAVLPMRCY